MSYSPTLSSKEDIALIPWNYAALWISLYFFINAFLYALTRFMLINKENSLVKQRWINSLEDSSISELYASKSSVLQVEDPTQESIPEADSRSLVDSTQITISNSSSTS